MRIDYFLAETGFYWIKFKHGQQNYRNLDIKTLKDITVLLYYYLQMSVRIWVQQLQTLQAGVAHWFNY